MNYDDIMKYKNSPNFRMVKLKGLPVVTPALKVPVVMLSRCSYCHKFHSHFWRLPDDVPFVKANDPNYPNYASRSLCQVTALKKED